MTGRLTITYRAPTALHQPLRFVAVIDEVEGRKIHTSAELRAGDRLCAEATGLFISVDFSRLAKLQDDRNCDHDDRADDQRDEVGDQT